MTATPAKPQFRFAPPGAFAREVNRRAHQAFTASGETRFADFRVWAYAGALALTRAGAYALLLIGAGGAVGSVASIVIAAFCSLMLIAHVGHDASHGALSPNRFVNRAVLFLTFAVIGVDGRMWADRHVRLHHKVVNLPGTGIDADPLTVLRLMPDKPWHWWHRFQPLYGPLILLMGHFQQVWIDDFLQFGAARACGRRDFTSPGAAVAFLASKAIHAGLFLVLPAVLLQPSPLALIGGYLLASAIISAAFVLLVVGTHISDLAEFPLPDADGNVTNDWATHQVVTSVDWAPTSQFAVDLAVGANAHVAHHLFPGHSHRHSAMLSKIIAEAAESYGIEHRVTSFGGMVAAQWRLMLALSRPDADAGHAYAPAR